MDALMPVLTQTAALFNPMSCLKGLPASINLKAELRVEGEVKASGTPVSTGSEPIGAGAYTTYASLTDWDETTINL